MDSERVILVAGITAVAAIVGSFILWGPSTAIQPKKKGTVIGLQNLGLTCYLNSLLQAMASCNYFIEWLNIQENRGEVAGAMRKLLNVLCGNSPPIPEDEYFVSPLDVVTALHHSGWKITNSQQDVHELLCTLITILEEEAHKSCVDVIIYSTLLVLTVHAVRDNDINETESVKRQHNAKSSLNTVASQSGVYNSNICCEGDASDFTKNDKYQLFENRICTKFKSCSFQRPRIAHDLNQSPRPSPFRGYITNKIKCTKCNYKSVLRYDKFDSISLHLPEPNNQNMHTLSQLLNNFVKNEIINGITCEGCNKNRTSSSDLITAPAVKLLRFGKLPACLCIHIVRTSFHEYGVYKRQDYVDFPEYIIMDPYLYKPKKGDIFSFWKDTKDIFPNGNSHVGNRCMKSINLTKHLYRLKAVIVHRGSHNDGHFMTYRRGTSTSQTQHRCSESRWYLVSDTEVKETTLYNVLTSVAYVLFYEKCSGLL
ncbi:hypothetical protein PGB90_002907 [Kerria lacca]